MRWRGCAPGDHEHIMHTAPVYMTGVHTPRLGRDLYTCIAGAGTGYITRLLRVLRLRRRPLLP